MLNKKILIAVMVTAIGTAGMTTNGYAWGWGSWDGDSSSSSQGYSQSYNQYNENSNSYQYGKKKYKYYRNGKYRNASYSYGYNSTSNNAYRSKYRYYSNSYQNAQANYNQGYGASRSMSYSSKGPASPRGTFIFDPKKLSWAAYDSSGNLVKTGAASGGRGFCPDIRRGCKTPVGRFTVYSKGSASCKSSKYPVERPGAPMPYCMFFHGGYAIHGSNNVPGYNASHGCIRTPPGDAAWLSSSFIRNGTRVVVLPYRA